MELVGKKSVRLEILARQSGQPHLVTLWRAPRKDPDFMRAVHENRVATLIQRNIGSRRDYALVGFFEQSNASYLLFPRPIAYAPESKIIGINYDRIQPADVVGEVYKSKRSRPAGIPMRESPRYHVSSGTNGTAQAKGKHQHPPLSVKAAKVFQGKALLVARQELEMTVEATSASAAKKLLKEELETRVIDLETARVSKKLLKISLKKHHS
jgi:hypothetical protein